MKLLRATKGKIFIVFILFGGAFFSLKAEEIIPVRLDDSGLFLLADDKLATLGDLWLKQPEAKSEIAKIIYQNNDKKKYCLPVFLNKKDRYLRPIIEVDCFGLKVSEQLLKAGFAVNYSLLPKIDEKRAKAEAYARKKHKGIWAKKSDIYFADSEKLSPEFEGFALVEGKVSAAAKIGKKIYLNFGADEKTDFTAALTSDVAKDLRKSGVEPLEMVDKRLLVRGFVRPYRGAYLEPISASAIMILPSKKAAKTK